MDVPILQPQSSISILPARLHIPGARGSVRGRVVRVLSTAAPAVGAGEGPALRLRLRAVCAAAVGAVSGLPP